MVKVSIDIVVDNLPVVDSESSLSTSPVMERYWQKRVFARLLAVVFSIVWTVSLSEAPLL